MAFFVRCWHSRALVTLVAFCFGTVSGQPLPALFTEQAESVVALRGYSTEGRSRLASVDPAVLSQLRTGGEVSCRVNLFAGIEYIAAMRRTETGKDGYEVHAGVIEGEANSQVLLVSRGESVAGSVLIPEQGSFQIVPKGSGVCLL